MTDLSGVPVEELAERGRAAAGEWNGRGLGELDAILSELVRRVEAAEANTLTPEEIDRILRWYGGWSPVSVEDDELADKLYVRAKLERIAEGDKRGD